MRRAVASDHVPTFPDLAGKTAVVTGGSKGIGAASCRALAANGVKVAVVARGSAAVDELVVELKGVGAEAIGLTADCTSLADLQGVREQVEGKFGPTDMLLAFAGGFTRTTPILELVEDEWRFVVDSNLTATFLTAKAFLPGMIERRRGSIVTMGSNAGRFLDITLSAAYAAAKGGIVVFTRHVAKEVGRYGVRVNCVAPATTLTERVKRLMDDERRTEIAAMSPLGRLGTPEDTAYAALYLCSDAAAWMTGVTIDITGGRIML
jgi:3-oxoacyl-[acyl-carrier protein] reductase